MEEKQANEAMQQTAQPEPDVTVVDEAAQDTDFTPADIQEFGEIIGERIIEALTEILGDREAERICSEIAEEARTGDRSIQDIIADKVSAFADIQPEDIERFIVRDDTRQEPSESRYDTLRARYDEVKDKYLFRNTFVLLDRLELNIEAYKTGMPGDKGKPVSGGEIAMNIIELTRSNVWESMLEIAVRNYFDQKYPAKVDAGTTVEEQRATDKAATNGRPDLVRDMSGTVRDDGLVTGRGVDLEQLGIDKRNPAAGQYMGVDMTKAPDNRDLSLEVWRSGRDIPDTVTINGQAERLFIPDVRLVEFNHDHYLVDPFGRVMASDVDPVTGKETPSYFRSLDISAYRSNEPKVEAAAAGKGISVEEYKAQVTESIKSGFVERLADGFEKHTDYLKNLLPDIRGTVEAYQEKIEQLSAAEIELRTKAATAPGVEQPETGGSRPLDTATEQKLEAIAAAKEKLTGAIEKMETRIEKIEATIDSYDKARMVAASDKVDVDAAFATVLRAEMDAVGKTGNEDYGITGEDLAQITETLASLDEKEADPVDTGTDAPLSPDDAADEDAVPDITKEDALPDNDAAAAAPFSETDTTEATGVETPPAAAPDVDGASGTVEQPFVENIVEDVEDDTDAVEREASMDGYAPAPYDGPAPATTEEWQEAQLERIKESIYEFQTEGSLEKETLQELIKDLGYEELDRQPDWVMKNLGDDVDDLLSDYRDMQNTIDRIDSRMDAADQYLELLDDPTVSAEDKLAAFEQAADKMGLSEEALEAIRIPPPDVSDAAGAVDTGTESVDTPPLPSGVDTRGKDDDAAVIAEESGAPVSAEDVKDALDRFLSQGPDGTFSFQEDFLDLHRGEVSESDLYDAFTDKVKEIEAEIKDSEEDVDPDVLQRLSDVFSSIEDAAISSVTYQAEHLSALVEAICTGDTDAVGDLLMEDYFNKVEAQLAPLERIADYLNEKFDPEWQADTEAIKEAVCEKLSCIDNENFVDRVCGIAETLNEIFHGFDSMLAHIADTYATSADQVDLPDVDDLDLGVDSDLPQNADMEIDERMDDGIGMDDIESDIDLSTHVESLRDFLSDVEAIGAGAEAATTAEEMEAAIAAL